MKMKKTFCLLLALCLLFGTLTGGCAIRTADATIAPDRLESPDTTGAPVPETPDDTTGPTAGTTETTGPAQTDPTEGHTDPPPTDPPATNPPPTNPPATSAPPAVTPPEGSGSSTFFDDAAFIGDSVTLMLRNVASSAEKPLGNATFLCAGSYAVRHAVANDLNSEYVIALTYQGQKMRPEDALAASGVKKVFIMLGMNDIGLLSVDDTIKNWGTFVANIRAKCPDMAIYIQSGSPIYIGGEIGSLNNKNMDAYNEKLKAFAAANGCYYVDVATYLKDANGGLAAQYCSDQYVHLTQAGAQVWINVLKNFVGE